jgi:pyruvate/2-oxoglutarate dehydrogenase complex dihydrolipoamide acyltransferase (E2) component
MIEIKMPEAGFSITEGTVIEWYKEVGDKVEEGENVVSVETDKITVEVPAERSGILHEVKYAAGEVVPVGGIIGLILEVGERPQEVKEAVHKKEEKEKAIKVEGRPQVKDEKDRRISPAAKAVAKAKGLNLSQIKTGTGPNGRIVKQDVLDFISRPAVAPVRSEITTAGTAAERMQEKVGAEKRTRIEFKAWRKVIADRMTASKRDIPHYTMSIEADVTELSRTIDVLRESESLHFTYIPFMMKAMVVGIEEVPAVNSYCDKEGYTILADINIGIAVDLGEKLLVPVIRNVKQKSIVELMGEIEGIVKKAREDRLEPPDVEGGTITLTNVGMFHIHSVTSIILPPQVAILYMGAAQELPGVWDGRIEIRKKMIFGATYDHRVINGAAGGRFLKKMKDYLEDLSELLMHLH